MSTQHPYSNKAMENMCKPDRKATMWHWYQQIANTRLSPKNG